MRVILDQPTHNLGNVIPMYTQAFDLLSLNYPLDQQKAVAPRGREQSQQQKHKILRFWDPGPDRTTLGFTLLLISQKIKSIPEHDVEHSKSYVSDGFSTWVQIGPFWYNFFENIEHSRTRRRTLEKLCFKWCWHLVSDRIILRSTLLFISLKIKSIS